MALLLGAFLAGILTVLAPCVLPLLPVIIGGSLGGANADKRRPLLIAGSLAVSLVVFTVLLKATTLLIAIPPALLTTISGSIIIALGIISFFPLAYSSFMARIGIEEKAQGVLQAGATTKNSVVGPIIIGAALGPVFSSCSPVYAYLLATVLPVSFAAGMVYIVAYVLGLSLALLSIAYFGQRLVQRIKFVSKPGGWFQRILATIFIIVGVLIVTGYDKRVQTWVSTHTPFDFDALSAQLIPDKGPAIASGAAYNVTPYSAPELRGLTNWINSEPQTLGQLRGKVVLVDFWTYSCINCIRNNPYLEAWHQTYKDQGLVILGIHAPEFAFEKVEANVRKAVVEQNISYPVALDNNFLTWNAFKNRYWPASYLIDAKGMVRRIHYGEGEYEQSEEAIRGLLQEAGYPPTKYADTPTNSTGVRADQTPETYLGSDRASNYVGSPALGSNPISTVTAASKLQPNQWTLGGIWEVQGQRIIAREKATLTISVSAKETYLVAGSESPTTMKVLINGNPADATNSGPDVKNGAATIQEPRLYRITSFTDFSTNTIQLEVEPGTFLNAFTFGG